MLFYHNNTTWLIDKSSVVGAGFFLVSIFAYGWHYNGESGWFAADNPNDQ